MTQSEVLATLNPSPIRRHFAYGVLAILGGLTIYLAFSTAPAFGFRIFLLILGVLILIAAERMRRSTSMVLTLTDKDLRDSAGTVLCALDNIEKIERGLFAFKPSHGFVVVTKHKQSFYWAPGMWWRFGKRVGVGGVTPSGPAKFMAERMAMAIADTGS